MRFSVYQDTDLRAEWQKHMRNVDATTRFIFNQFVRETQDEIDAMTPKKSGLLRRGTSHVIRGYLKVSFFTQATDPKTGDEYAEEQHKYRHKKYTTPGTHDHFISIPLAKNSATLIDALNDVYMGRRQQGKSYFRG